MAPASRLGAASGLHSHHLSPHAGPLPGQLAKSPLPPRRALPWPWRTAERVLQSGGSHTHPAGSGGRLCPHTTQALDSGRGGGPGSAGSAQERQGGASSAAWQPPDLLGLSQRAGPFGPGWAPPLLPVSPSGQEALEERKGGEERGRGERRDGMGKGLLPCSPGASPTSALASRGHAFPSGPSTRLSSRGPHLALPTALSELCPEGPSPWGTPPCLRPETCTLPLFSVFLPGLRRS